MELPLNEYRLEIFKNQMTEEDYDFLIKQRVIQDGYIKIERRGNRVFLIGYIKRTKFESYSSQCGESLGNNLKGMYLDLIEKIKAKN